MRKGKIVSFCLPLIVVCMLIVSCTESNQTSAVEENQDPSPNELLARIENGLSKAEVEAILGKPQVGEIASSGFTWYLSPPTVELHESPYAPGTIGIEFSEAGEVTSFKLNPQYEAAR